MTIEDCIVCGYGRDDHDPETGRVPSATTGCACQRGSWCATSDRPAEHCPFTRHHVFAASEHRKGKPE